MSTQSRSPSDSREQTPKRAREDGRYEKLLNYLTKEGFSRDQAVYITETLGWYTLADSWYVEEEDIQGLQNLTESEKRTLLNFVEEGPSGWQQQIPSGVVERRFASRDSSGGAQRAAGGASEGNSTSQSVLINKYLVNFALT